MKTVCGLDIASLKSGCAVIDGNETHLYSLILDAKTPLEERIYRHLIWSEVIAARHDIEICFIEEVLHVHHGGGYHENGKFENIRTGLLISQCVGAVKAGFHGCIIYPLPPSEWRKLTVGNISSPKGTSERTALKARAIAYARAHGVEPRNDDEAEAFAICKAGLILTEETA